MKKSRVENYYDAHANEEWARMDRHRTEFAVTMKAFEEFLPPPPLSLLDIGGGPGRYALALTTKGYNVTLLDLAESNLKLAQQKSAENKIPLAGVKHGDALSLNGFAAGSFDAALLLGPLYHLIHEQDRITAARQAWRILKPGGLIFAAFITRYAPFRDYVASKPEEVFAEKAEWEKLWLDGVNFGEGFTDAYFSMPDEVLPLMESQGFTTLQVLGVEGIAAGHEEFLNVLEGETWEYWVNWNYTFAKDPALHAAANHLLYIGKKMSQP